ncbi:hypothetical protein SCIP_0259 [Scardovia inopinata JCM 12537]|nr:hypothetical protein SCIP_0259 [Scardovia inopinata JCM 12537]
MLHMQSAAYTLTLVIVIYRSLPYHSYASPMPHTSLRTSMISYDPLLQIYQSTD